MDTDYRRAVARYEPTRTVGGAGRWGGGDCLQREVVDLAGLKEQAMGAAAKLEADLFALGDVLVGLDDDRA